MESLLPSFPFLSAPGSSFLFSSLCYVSAALHLHPTVLGQICFPSQLLLHTVVVQVSVHTSASGIYALPVEGVHRLDRRQFSASYKERILYHPLTSKNIILAIGIMKILNTKVII